MLSRSNLPVSPAAATDHWNAELKKMSDSTSAPVDESIRKLVEARTRSRSGRLRKPRTEEPSSLPGFAEVTPAS